MLYLMIDLSCKFSILQNKKNAHSHSTVPVPPPVGSTHSPLNQTPHPITSGIVQTRTTAEADEEDVVGAVVRVEEMEIGAEGVVEDVVDADVAEEEGGIVILDLERRTLVRVRMVRPRRVLKQEQEGKRKRKWARRGRGP